MKIMDWIKQNYDQFILGLVALLLLVLSGLLINNALGFQQIFAGIKGQVFHNNTIPVIDMSGINNAGDALAKPGSWTLTDTEGSLFVSIPYIAKDGQLFDPRTSRIPLHPPVPNKWIIDNKLDILDNNILNQDPDGTGFTVLDDWKNVKGDGSDSIDPQDKNAHPPYYTKLRFVQYIKVPFRLLFNAYDGDLKKPEEIQFQINTIDVNQPSQFVKIGDEIAGTKFKVMKFEFKNVLDPNTGSNTDVSELTVQNTENGDTVVLVLGQLGNSPESYAQFNYLWANKTIVVHVGKPFALLPDAKNLYTLKSVTDDAAVIVTPGGQEITIPKTQ